MSDHHHLYMKRAFELAENGLGNARPNPIVGAVIVHNGTIIGEGWHQAFGGPHAEVNAVDSVKNKALLKESTIYVNLEPCAHFGNTPPCADLLVEHRLRKVVISNIDSNPLVGGKGIEKLKKAGIEVETGILEKEGRELNKRFFTFIEKERPYIILKWAQTADGYLGRVNFDSKWISNEFSRKLVHKWRSEEAAIMIGPNTAHYDNPMLNVREWSGNNPLRLVIDRHLRLEPSLNVFDQKIPTICYNLKQDKDLKNLHFVKLNEADFFKEMMKDLYSKKVQSVIVEGGSMLLSYMISMGLWDEARVFYSINKFKKGIQAPTIIGDVVSEEKILNDKLIILKNTL